MPMPSFFGGRRRAFPFDAMNPVLTQTEQKPDMPTGEVTARSGVRGLFTRKSLPNTLNVIGAGLRQMDGGNELDDYLAGQQDQQYRRDMFGLRAAQGKREDEEAERTRQERLAALAALPENLRPIAPLLTNEAISNAVLPPSPEYQIDAQGRPYTIQNGRVQFGEGQVAVPQRGGAAAGQYRPITPEEAQAYGISNPAGFAMAPNGRPIRVGGGGTFSPDQRARVEIGLDPAMEAVQTLDQLETGGNPRASRTSPRNQQWGASVIDMIDGEGTSAAARNWGGQEFQRYTSAGSAFESGLLPILSGAAVTDSEARRMIRAALPQLGDGPEVLAEKARRRRQMINGAAIIGGREPPYPQDAVPAWATRAQQAYGNANAGAGDTSGMPQGAIDDGITADEWEAMTPDERSLWQ